MNTTQLEIAKRIWGFSMDITLEGNRLIVANDGYITDNPAEVKSGKHAGEFEGFYYYSKRKGTANVLRNVILSISEMQEVTA